MRRLWQCLLLSAGAAAAGCATPGIVVVSDSYDPSHVHRVALVGFSDFPGALGSGDIAAGTFEKYLLLGHYSLVERSQIASLLREQSFDLSGAVDEATIVKIGKILGVDALAFGTLSDFSNTQEQTVMVDVPQEQSEPIYGRVTTIQHKGDMEVRSEQKMVTGYNVVQTGDASLPETETLPARVGMSVRLVDAQTGEVLWSASASSEGSNLSAALEQASSKLMQAVSEQLKKIQKKPLS